MKQLDQHFQARYISMSLNSIEYFSQACRLVLFHLKSYITVNSCQRFLDFDFFNSINFSSFYSRAKSFWKSNFFKGWKEELIY